MKNVSRSNLAKAFVELAKPSNYKQLLAELARELMVSRRTAEVDLLLRDIKRELLKQKRQLEAEVFTAHKLQPSMLAEIEQHLRELTGASKVNASLNIQEDLVGGLLVETPDELLDLSLKYKLEQLEV